MTTYIAAYDTEAPGCLEALPALVSLHERHGMPATFFVVSGLLDTQPGRSALALLRDRPWCEIASHSRTHSLLRAHPANPEIAPTADLDGEILESKRQLEEFYARRITGFRPPWGYSDGFRRCPQILSRLQAGGYGYVSSLAWGPQESMPALILEPFTYAEEGFSGLWEIPACGWHENILKSERPPLTRPIQLYPHPMPEALRAGPVRTPEEEFSAHRLFIDAAVRKGAGNVSLIWHPWSLWRFDSSLRMIGMLFDYVRQLQLPRQTYAGYASTLRPSRPAQEAP